MPIRRCVAAVHLLVVVVGCESAAPTRPSLTTSLPLVHETASMLYFHEPGDSIDIDRQEVYNAWAAARLGVQPLRRVEYHKYVDRAAMGRYTGNANVAGFAQPLLWQFHTTWRFDNHEVVHVYSALIGRPSTFFNEGLAVSMQTDPARGDTTPRFGGLTLHDASRSYLTAGSLPLPLSDYVTTAGFGRLTDGARSYRMAGSFVLHLIERFGMPVFLEFIRDATPEDSLHVIRDRMQTTFGITLEEAEADWLTMLRSASR